ncbi:MAG: Rrf2 family transcriptional regulator [Anaerohalosphaera sp.]|nr:Rrf2 family transcriptional regulator [Anaerohalosphaera sp.]
MQEVTTHFGNVSRKCRYALRAMFELTLRQGGKPLKVNEIAASQSISVRFLEVILSELRQGGFVESRRGKSGGYLLARKADSIFVGQIINFVQGNGHRDCLDTSKQTVPGDWAMAGLWRRVNEVVDNIYNNTSFADLIAQEAAMKDDYIGNYVI